MLANQQQDLDILCRHCSIHTQPTRWCLPPSLAELLVKSIRLKSYNNVISKAQVDRCIKGHLPLLRVRCEELDCWVD
jgi:hypothetical protein